MEQPGRLPIFRFECIDAPRPCPHFRCRWHLARENSNWERTGESCVLDVVDKGPHGLDVIGAVMGITGEGVRRIEIRAIEKLRASGAAREIFDAMDGVPTGRVYASTREVLLLDTAPEPKD